MNINVKHLIGSLGRWHYVELPTWNLTVFTINYNRIVVGFKCESRSIPVIRKKNQENVWFYSWFHTRLISHIPLSSKLRNGQKRDHILIKIIRLNFQYAKSARDALSLSPFSTTCLSGFHLTPICSDDVRTERTASSKRSLEKDRFPFEGPAKVTSVSRFRTGCRSMYCITRWWREVEEYRLILIERFVRSDS